MEEDLSGSPLYGGARVPCIVPWSSSRQNGWKGYHIPAYQSPAVQLALSIPSMNLDHGSLARWSNSRAPRATMTSPGPDPKAGRGA